jgi:hypothetical protein
LAPSSEGIDKDFPMGLFEPRQRRPNRLGKYRSLRSLI